ncbi:hypothetical protein DA2_0823 [Desulfovibrio sp. A2]|nr:hypothetical protein DA2_0823 [Desulfovibrio sp. A2]
MAACSTNVSVAIRIFVRWQGKRVCRGGSILLWYLTGTADEV